MLVGQLLLGSGVWQDCQSFPTRTLHQQTLSPSRGHSSILAYPHAETVVSSPHAQVLAFLLTQRPGRAASRARFCCVCEFRGWGIFLCVFLIVVGLTM